jgi:nucleoid DNA-binding protein
MNREDITEAVSREFHLTRSETVRIIEYMTERAIEALKSGERVYLRNFGSLHKVTRAPRKGYNFKKKKTITVPQREDVQFRPAAALLEKINK